MADRQQILTASMLNTDAYALGTLSRDAGRRGVNEGVGDEIDRGLILLRLLNERGYDVVKKHDGACFWGRPGMECTCIYRKGALPPIAADSAGESR